MTRETKVGLVIGLGVILLVGIIVSEYFVRDEALQDQSLANGMSDFNNNTNQPAMHTPLANGGEGNPYAPGTNPMHAMSAVEQVTDPERLATQGTPTPPGPGRRRGPQRPGANVALDPPGQPSETPPATPGGTVAGHHGHEAGHHAAAPPTREETPAPGRRPVPAAVAGNGDGDIPELITTQPIDPLPTEPPRPAAVEHTVAEGETLTQIARRYYSGDGNMWRSIRDANPGLVGEDGQVRAGTTLIIPKRGGASAQADSRTEADDINQALSSRDRERSSDGRSKLVTVAEGDTLSDIASEHLGSANRWQLILDANPDVLTDPNQIRAGMRLRIPAPAEADVADRANEALAASSGTTQTSEQPPAADRDEPTPATRTYTVQDGDSLYRIAQLTLGSGNRYQEIYQINRDKLDSPNDIREGMVLRLPEGANGGG